MRAALETYVANQEFFEEAVTELQEVRRDSLGVSKTATRLMVNQGSIPPAQVKKAIEAAPPECRTLLKHNNKAYDGKDVKRKNASIKRALQQSAVLEYLRSEGATKEELRQYDEEIVKPGWEEEANNNITPCFIGPYQYNSGELTKCGKDAKFAKFCIEDFERNPEGWPEKERMEKSHKYARYYEICESYKTLRGYVKKIENSNPILRESVCPRRFWYNSIVLCKKYAQSVEKEMPAYLIELGELLTPPSGGRRKISQQNTVPKETGEEKETEEEVIHDQEHNNNKGDTVKPGDTIDSLSEFPPLRIFREDYEDSEEEEEVTYNQKENNNKEDTVMIGGIEHPLSEFRPIKLFREDYEDSEEEEEDL